MSYYANDFEMEEADSGGFTFTAVTGATPVYSEEYDLSMIEEATISVKYAYTNESGAIPTVTLQIYDRTHDYWHNHATTITAGGFSGVTEYAFNHFANLPIKARLKIAVTGTFGTSPAESVMVTINFAGKGKI